MEKGDARLIIAWERLVAARFIDPLAAPDPSDPCWRFAVWRQPSKTGHRTMMVFYEVDLVHRWSYRIWHGPIPEGMQVNHHCDVSDCFRPNHLYAGTQSQNTLDAVRRGRYVKNRGGAKLTWEQVDEIRESFQPSRVLAERYGVTRDTINRIRRGSIWRQGDRVAQG